MYSFEAQATEEDTAQRLLYRFVVDSNGVPRKLGDGSYGSVFEARDPANQRCAVKLFYPVKKEDISGARNGYEMRAGVRVRDELSRHKLEGLESNLVLSTAWTENFCSSESYESLKDKFAQLGVSVSDQALVMPYYECTLKDVLEAGAPAGRLVEGRTIDKPGPPGYEVLRNLTIAEREGHIVEIVSQVATGLRALHAAKLFHHDIKPANVMLRSKGDDVEVALGDFGFLEVLPSGHASGYESALPPGTRHYRSPEQKDFFDVCEVKVEVPDGGQRLVLHTADMKFRDTLMEGNDVAVFSKDGEQKGYEVIGVEHLNGGGSQITLKAARKKEFEDDRTQVMFYKKPSLRTDVFGLGALLFDLLTVGKSPEGFYDHLRPFDRSGDAGVASVEVLVDRYRAASGATSTSADMAPLFDQVRDHVHGQFPSDGIIAVLFRCMLSRKRDSYYEQSRGEDGSVNRMKLFSGIQDDLARLVVGTRVPGRLGSSPIWADDVSKSETAQKSETFLEKLVEMRNLPAPKRLLMGALRLRQLTRMIDGIHKQGMYFADLNPGNLRFDNRETEISAVVGTYESEEDYRRAVRSGTAWRLETGGNTDSFVPVYRRFDVRSVEVDISPEATETGTLTAQVRYSESMPVWRRCSAKDLLRVIDTHGQPRLFEIREVEPEGVWKGVKVAELVPSDDGELPSEPQPDKSIDITEARGTVIRRLSPMACYLSNVATYIHHLFFSDGGQDNGTIPDVIWSFVQDRTAGKGRFTLKKPEFKERKLMRTELIKPGMRGVHSMVAWTYLDLISMSETRDAHAERGAEMMLTTLAKHTDELDETIARWCGIDRYELTAYGPGDLDNLLAKVPPETDNGTFAQHLEQRLGS